MNSKAYYDLDIDRDRIGKIFWFQPDGSDEKTLVLVKTFDTFKTFRALNFDKINKYKPNIYFIGIDLFDAEREISCRGFELSPFKT